MKILKDISPADSVILHNVVNQPGGGNPLMTSSLAEDRTRLFLQIVGDAPVVDPKLGLYDYDQVGTRDLILKNSDWNLLKECFKNAAWPSVWHRIESKKLEEKVKGAEDFKSPQNADTHK